ASPGTPYRWVFLCSGLHRVLERSADTHLVRVKSAVAEEQAPCLGYMLRAEKRRFLELILHLLDISFRAENAFKSELSRLGHTPSCLSHGSHLAGQSQLSKNRQVGRNRSLVK